MARGWLKGARSRAAAASARRGDRGRGGSERRRGAARGSHGFAFRQQWQSVSAGDMPVSQPPPHRPTRSPVPLPGVGGVLVHEGRHSPRQW
jgi:hypothetical protein